MLGIACRTPRFTYSLPLLFLTSNFTCNCCSVFAPSYRLKCRVFCLFWASSHVPVQHGIPSRKLSLLSVVPAGALFIYSYDKKLKFAVSYKGQVPRESLSLRPQWRKGISEVLLCLIRRLWPLHGSGSSRTSGRASSYQRTLFLDMSSHVSHLSSYHFFQTLMCLISTHQSVSKAEIVDKAFSVQDIFPLPIPSVLWVLFDSCHPKRLSLWENTVIPALLHGKNLTIPCGLMLL